MDKLVKKIILPFLLVCAFFALYLHNLSRVVYGGDVGDLVTAAALGGVAHPPGYPLFTLLGFLLTRMHLFSSPAFSVGFISAFFGAFGVFFFYILIKTLTQNKLVSLIAANILGFSFLYWFYSEIAEVFALNAFFVILLCYLAVLFWKNKKPFVLFVFFFVLGLSFTNHQTIILIVPSLLLLIGKHMFVIILKRPIALFWIFLSFLLGITPIAYIFIASSKHPILNWDNVHDVGSFLHLFLRQDYGTFQAGVFNNPSFSQRLVTLGLYFQYLVVQLTIPVVVIVLIGLFQYMKKNMILFFTFLSAWILSGPAFIAYAGFPLTGNFIIGAYERFLLLSMIIFLIPFGSGLIALSKFLAGFLPKRHYDVLFQCVFFFIPLMLFVYNFPKTNLSQVTVGQTYAEDFLRPLPKNAILLISGDTEVFNAWYVYYVLHIRPDILLYNFNASPIRANEIARSLGNIPVKENSRQLIAILQKMQHTRPVFSTIRLSSKDGNTITWVPYGLSFQMYLPGDALPTEAEYIKQLNAVGKQLHIPTNDERKNLSNHNLTITDIPFSYSNSYIAAGTFLYTQYKDANEALLLYEKAKQIAPNNDKAYIASAIIYTTLQNKCNETANNLVKAISLNPYQELSYTVLYNTYTTCLNDQNSAKNVANTFKSIFQKDLRIEIEKTQKSLIESFQSQ